MGPHIRHPHPRNPQTGAPAPHRPHHRNDELPRAEPPHPNSPPQGETPIAPPPFPRVGFSFNVPNPLTLDLTTPPAATAIFRSPLTQGATGMVPIEPSTRPTTTAAHLQNRSGVDHLEDQIKAEIQRRQLRLEREQARHPGRAPTEDRQLSALLRLRDELGRLKTASQIRSTGFRNLVAQARQLLLTGATQRNRDTVREGQRIAAATWNYYQAHTRREQVLQVIRDHYPPSSRGIQTGYFHVPEEERNPNDPSTDTLNNTSIIRTYERLSRSSNPQDQAMAHAFSGAIADLHHPSALSDTATLRDVETGTILFHNLYGNPTDREHPHAIVQFLGQVRETTRHDLEHNEGYQSRIRLQESLASLENLRQSAHILESTGDTLPPEVVNETRTMLIQRLEAAQISLLQEMRRLQANRPYDQTARYREGNHWEEEAVPSRTPTAEESRLEQLHQECTALQSRLRNLRNDDPQATQRLTEAFQTTLRAEEENTRILIHGELRQANSPELTDDINRVQTRTGNFSDLGVRLEHYQHAMERMDTAIMRESIRSRIEMYRSMLPLVQSTDHTMTILSAGQGGDADFTSRYQELIHRYERIGQSIDTGHIDQARRDFTQLEQAQVGSELQDHFVFSGRLQTGIAIGIVAASACAMNAAGLALLPETALAIEAGEATLGARMAYAAATAPAFQLTHYAASDLLTGTHHLYDPTQTARENILRYAEDYVRNVGNNAAIGETLRFVQQTAFARIAERQLIQEGTLAAQGTRSVAETALIRARSARIAQDGITRAGVSTAALAPELGAVQAWGFLDRNLTDLVHGRFDLNRGTEDTLLNSQAWQDQAIFILGMRVGHLTTTPLLGPINRTSRDIAMARVRGRYTEALRASQAAGEAWNRYVTEGEGRGADVRARLQEAVAARQRLEQHPAVRNLVTPEQHAETQRLSDALARTNDMRLNNPYRNPLFGLTFGILGADGAAFFVPSSRRTTTRPSRTSEPARTASPADSTSPPQSRTDDLISAALDLNDSVGSHRQGTNSVEVAIDPHHFESTRSNITTRARQLGLRGVANLGSDDLVFENPHTQPPERLTIHFTRLQGQEATPTQNAHLPVSSNPLANPSYILARNLGRTLGERNLPTIAYDPNNQKLTLRAQRGADLIADGNLVESLIPTEHAQHISREDPGDGRHILRIRDADGRPLLTIEIDRRDRAGRPPALPRHNREGAPTGRRNRNRAIQSSPVVEAQPHSPETPPIAPRSIPRTPAGIRTPDALADWFMRRIHMVDPATATSAVLPDNIRYDEPNHRIILNVPLSQIAQTKRYICTFMGGRLRGDRQVSRDSRVLRFSTSAGQPDLNIEIMGTASYRNPNHAQETQPGAEPTSQPVATPSPTPPPLPASDPTLPTTTSTPAQTPTTTVPPARLTNSPHVPQIQPAGSPIVEAPRVTRRGPHPLTTGWIGALAPLFLGVGGGGIGGIGRRRPLPITANGTTPIPVTGNPSEPSPVTIGSINFAIVRENTQNQQPRWAISSQALPSGHRWRVVRGGSEITDPNILRAGLNDGDQVSIVQSRIIRADTVLGTIVFRTPPTEAPPIAQPATAAPVIALSSPPTPEATYTPSVHDRNLGRGNIPGANATVSTNHLHVEYDGEGNMRLRDGAPRDGHWTVSANGVSVYHDGQAIPLPRGGVPTGRDVTEAQRRLDLNVRDNIPDYYFIPPGGSGLFNIAGRWIRINNPISFREAPTGQMEIANASGERQTLHITEQHSGSVGVTGTPVQARAVNLNDRNPDTIVISLHNVRGQEVSRFALPAEEAVTRGFVTPAANRYYIQNPRIAEREIFVSDSSPSRSFSLPQLSAGQPWIIGRGANAHVRINDQQISRRHADIMEGRAPNGEPTYTLTPYYSRSSLGNARTYVRNNRGDAWHLVTEPTPLQNGQEILFGNVDENNFVTGNSFIFDKNPQDPTPTLREVANHEGVIRETLPARPDAVPTTSTADPIPQAGDSTNPGMSIPAFLGMASNINLVTIGGTNRRIPGTVNIDFPGLNAQSSPPILFRRTPNGWELNRTQGNLVFINGEGANNGALIHSGDQLEMRIMSPQGGLVTRQGTVTEHGIEIEGNSQQQTDYQAAARDGDATIVTPPRTPDPDATPPQGTPRPRR